MSDLRHVKITQKGWDNFNGTYGQIEFKDSISVRPINQFERDRIAALIHISDAESGAQVGTQVDLIAGHTKRSEGIRAAERAQAEDHARKARAGATKMAPKPVPKVEDKDHTEEELGSVVDRHGINGLRAIATPLGVKARSIPELIVAILKAQAERGGRSIETGPEKTGTAKVLNL